MIRAYLSKWWISNNHKIDPIASEIGDRRLHKDFWISTHHPATKDEHSIDNCLIIVRSGDVADLI